MTWDILTWDVLTLGHFDSGTFDLGRFDFGMFRVQHVYKTVVTVLPSDVILGTLCYSVTLSVTCHKVCSWVATDPIVCASSLL